VTDLPDVLFVGRGYDGFPRYSTVAEDHSIWDALPHSAALLALVVEYKYTLELGDASFYGVCIIPLCFSALLAHGGF